MVLEAHTTVYVELEITEPCHRAFVALRESNFIAFFKRQRLKSVSNLLSPEETISEFPSVSF